MSTYGHPFPKDPNCIPFPVSDTIKCCNKLLLLFKDYMAKLYTRIQGNQSTAASPSY
jgi:hypothetical protein